MGPLGPYDHIVTAFAASASIIAAIVLHAIGHPDTFVDSVALLAFGVIYGTAVPRQPQ